MPDFASPAAGGIGADEALEVRRTIYAHDPLTPADMDLVFRTQRESAGPDSNEWTNLFSEAVTDYVVHQNEPADYIPQDKADWLAATLKAPGAIATAEEFAMLVDVMKSALGVPPSLSAFALREVETAIVSGRRGAIGGSHPPVTVTKTDVDTLRSILYAATSNAACHVTREQAEALFDIAHATANGTVDPAFDDFFARAVGNYLTAICLHDASRDEMLHLDNWLDEREGTAGFFARMFKPGPKETYRQLMKSPLERADEDMAAIDHLDDAARADADRITGDESDWVIAHLTRQGPLTSAETRLLKWLGSEGATLPPKLRALVDKANDVRSRAA